MCTAEVNVRVGGAAGRHGLAPVKPRCHGIQQCPLLIRLEDQQNGLALLI